MKKVLTIICSFLFINGYCQQPEAADIIANIAEELASDEDNPEGVELFTDQLYDLAENPVKINSADEKELSRLFFLSDFQVKSLADYVRSSGSIVTIYEVAAIPGFDRQIAVWIQQFITLSDKPDLSLKPGRLNNTLLTNFTLKSGKHDTSNFGSPVKILTRYRFSAGSFSGGFTGEKDPGEKIVSGSPPLPDFLSAHISYTGNGLVRKIILGDFACKSGLGTNINTGMRTALSLTSTGYLSGKNEIKPWTSAEENNFLRGVASELSFKNVGLIFFCSYKEIDATTSISSDSSASFIKSLYTGGFHSTVSLLSKKDAVNNTSAGVNIAYNFRSARIGFTYSHDRFSVPFMPDEGYPENRFDFTGRINNVYSSNYSCLINRILLFGEVTVTYRRNLAAVQGITIRPSDRFSVNFLYRNYSPGFISFHGKGPGISTATGNETGILGNFSLEIAKHLFITAGCDISNSPWLKYRKSFPSMAKRYEVKLKYLPNDKYSFDFTYYSRFSMSDISREQGIASVCENMARSVRGIARLNLSENISFTTRIDAKFAEPAGTTGMLLLQDLKYSFREVPLTLWFRYCISRTDDWNSRLYTYENDLLYSFSIPALSGTGNRSYIMLKWDLKDFAEVRFKYGMTEKLYSGSVPEAVHEFKMQVRLWF